MKTQSVTAFEPTIDSRNIERFRRESSFWSSLSLIDLDKGCEVASVRFYGSSMTVYCVAWIWANQGAEGARGYGKAGGGGYHKASAAMGEALKRAGVTLAEPIEGRGDSAMTEALEALARHIGIARPFIHRAHA